MSRIRTKHPVAACFLFLLPVSGCGDDGSITDEPGPAPAITTISPDSGRFGQEVTLTGAGFGATTEDNTVTFNGMEATVIRADRTELVAEVPRGAGSGRVEVTVAGRTGAGLDFHYLVTAVVSTLAGTGQAGDNDGPGSQARFDTPMGIRILENGDLAVADYSNRKIRRVTPGGEVTTILSPGMTDRAMSDFLLLPDGDEYLAPDHDHHVIYMGRLSDSDRWQELGAYGTPGHEDGILADPGNDIRFDRPRSMSRSPDGGREYITDLGNHCIRVIDHDDNVVATFAGTSAAGFEDGPGSDARFNSPAGMDVDGAGNLYIADRDNHSIRRVTPEGEVTTIAGGLTPAHRDGPANQALFHTPTGAAVHIDGAIYVADYGNNSIRRITAEGEVTTILMGLSGEGFTDGVGTQSHPSGMPLARIDGPTDLKVAEDGTIYLSDRRNHAIRRITFE